MLKNIVKYIVIMSVNIFGSSRNKSNANNIKYIDSKFITLTKNLNTKLDKSGGVLSGDLNMGTSKISLSHEAEELHDVPNKKYVDGVIFQTVSNNGQSIIDLTKNVVTKEQLAEILKTKADKNVELNMNNNFISNLLDPQDKQDATTKGYVDRKRTKNNVGYVPQLNSNDNNKYGFIVSASSELIPNSAHKVFSAYDQSWRTAGMHRDFWIKLKCPEEIKVHKFSLKGAGPEKIISWSLQGSNDDVKWEELYIAMNKLIRTDFKFYSTRELSNKGAFIYFRIYVVISEVGNPGLTHWQLYTVN